MVEYGSVLDGYIVPGEPLVSVKVTAYNHGKYIRQCLDGILMQKVNFPYEVLVHDDASPDDTADIIREYEARFPTVIKPIYQTENQYSKHDGTIGRIQNGRAKGKYIAQCEGDDYWTDPGKLQMQVDFLEEHPEYIACTHRVKVIIENNEESVVHPYVTQYFPGEFKLDDVERYDVCWGIAGQLATIVAHNLFRTTSKRILDNYYSCKTNGDNKYSLFLALNGVIYRLDSTMSVYRYITQYGTSWSATMMIVDNPKSRICGWFSELERFAKESYNVNLDYSNSRADCIIRAILQILVHPSKSKIRDFIGVINTCNIKSILSTIPRIFILAKRFIVRRISNKSCRTNDKHPSH